MYKLKVESLSTFFREIRAKRIVLVYATALVTAKTVVGDSSKGSTWGVTELE